jgi:hypothetical protein
VVEVIRPVVRDGHLDPPEVRRHGRLGVVDLLRDALMLAPRRAGRRSTEYHHDGTTFLGEIVVLDVLAGTGVGHILWLVLPAEVSLHEVAILHGMLDRSLMVRTRYLKHLLKVIPQGTSLWLGRSLVGRHYQVVGAELALFLLFLLRTGSRSFI